MSFQSRVRSSDALTICYNKPHHPYSNPGTTGLLTTSATTDPSSFLVPRRELSERRYQLSFQARTFELFLKQRYYNLQRAVSPGRYSRVCVRVRKWILGRGLCRPELIRIEPLAARHYEAGGTLGEDRSD